MGSSSRKQRNDLAGGSTSRSIENNTTVNHALHQLSSTQRGSLSLSGNEFLWTWILLCWLGVGWSVIGVTTGVSLHISFLDEFSTRGGAPTSSNSINFVRHHQEQRVQPFCKATSLDSYIAWEQVAPDADRRLVYVLTVSPDGRQQTLLPCVQPSNWKGPSDSFTQNSTTLQSSQPPRLEWDWQAPLCPNKPHNALRGVSDWHTLRDAIRYANRLSARYFVLWNAYFSHVPSPADESQDAFILEDSSLYFKPQWAITLCPGSRIVAPTASRYVSWWRYLIPFLTPSESKEEVLSEPTIQTNSQQLTIQCGNLSTTTQQTSIEAFLRSPNTRSEVCYWDAAGGKAHVSLGPHADVSIRGPFVFRGATHASIMLKHDGSSLRVSDAHFVDNTRIADVNSSAVKAEFNRCDCAPVGNGAISVWL